MTIRCAPHVFAVAAASLVLAACGGAGGGIAPQPGADAQTQGAAYVPQSAGAPGTATAAAFQGKVPVIEAFPKPLPEPLLAIGHGVSPDITKPIIDDSGSYTNGPIIRATNTTTGYGMEGITDGGGAGVYGHSGSSSITSYGVYGFAAGGAGVYGYASNAGKGVYGSSVNGDGVEGITENGAYGGYFTNSNDGGALDASTGGSGDAVDASSTSGIGVSASSTNYFGVIASSSSGNNAAIEAVAESNEGVASFTGGGDGASSLAYYGNDSNGNGADITGTYIGAVLRTPTGTGTYPLVLTDTSGNNLFYVDGDGDVAYKGTSSQFIATKTRGHALAYGATTATPTIEDTGTARMVNGAATVPLDAAFAQTIDPQRTYQVMLTPDGDTRGLYVASKTATAFVVREVQGGRGSLDFDYHIYAAPLGHARERMALVSGAEAGPRAPAIHPNVTRPALRPPGKTH